MTVVQAEDGSQIVTDLPAEQVADINPPAAEEAKVEEPKTPVEAPKTEEPKADPIPETPKEPEEPAPTTVDRQPKKATPFQNLLEKKHEAEQQRDEALAKAAELEAKIQEAAGHKTAETPADIKALADKYDLKEDFVAEMIGLARAGIKPELPKEVQTLIAKQQEQEQQQAEEAAFKADYGRLSATLEADKSILKSPEVQERLKELAYSTEKAPDGEPYFKKPLFELYMKFVRPEHEPGKATVEENRGGNKGGKEVLDFAEIHNDDAKLDDFAKNSTREQWQAYEKWRDAKGSDVPIIRLR